MLLCEGIKFYYLYFAVYTFDPKAHFEAPLFFTPATVKSSKMNDLHA